MKPSIPNQNKAYNALYSRLVNYMAQVQSIYDRIASQVAIAVDGVDYDGSAEFLFQNYPELTQTINGLMSSYAAQMNNLIYAGTTNEWKESNTMQDLLARKVLRAYDFEKGGDKYNRYFQPNSEALKAFQERTDRGMNLSQKLWVQSQGLKKELENTISTAIDKGQSAVVLSKRISQYLNDFPSLKKDYGEKFGKAINSRDCQYASIRLARTEINMAYRKAEQLRWQQFDFILGYEVKLSKRHPAPDICDDLKGKYPKDFVFLGWHPNCMCYVVPIIMSDEQYYGSETDKKEGMIERTPKVFNDWVRSNRVRIGESKTLPYFLQDNRKYWHLSVEDATKYRHADRDEKAIRRAARNRELLQIGGIDTDDTDIARLRRHAKTYNVDISKFEKYLSTHEFKESSGVMTSKQEQELSEMIEKYEEKVLASAKAFDAYKKGLLSKFDYSYDFGDWKDNARRKFANITPSQFETANDLRPKIKLAYEDAKKELQQLRSIPLVPKKLIEDFDDFEWEISLGDQEGVMAGKAMLQKLYGRNLDFNTTWTQIANAVKSEGWGKGYEIFAEEYERSGLKQVLESATHLNELRSADLSVIPQKWVPRFNDYIKTIENARIDVRGYHRVYREIEGAYNIWKLSTDKDLISYGLDKLSFNTPHTIVDGFRSIGMSPTKWLGDKKFYDTFDKFVPCISLNDSKAHFWGRYGFVRIDFEGHKMRFQQSEWYRKSLQYHEFGHAKDALQGSWRQKEDFKKLFKKFYDDYNKGNNYYIDYKGDTRWKIEDSVLSKYYSEKDLLKIGEQYSSISDTIQALSKTKTWIKGLGGHEVEYFAESESQCLAEIIAHLSENYWAKNQYFQKALPRFYNEAMALYKKYLRANLPIKR